MSLSALVLCAGAINLFWLPATIVPEIPVIAPRPLGELRQVDAAKTLDLERKGDEAYARNDLARAESYYGQAKAAAQIYGQARQTASSSAKLAVILAESGKLWESRQMSVEALSYYHKAHILDINHAALLQNLGWVSNRLGMKDESKLWYRQAIKYYSAIDTRTSHLLSAMCARRLARLCIETGDARTAVHYYKQCVPLYEQYCPDPDLVVLVRVEYAAARQLMRQQGRLHERNK